MMFISLLAVIAIQIADRVSLRTLTAKKEPVSISVKDTRIRLMDVETQEIVNDESVIKFSERAISVIMNYRPGKTYEHVNSGKVTSLFINGEKGRFFKKFREQFMEWSFYEFNVNNISIKEAIATNGRLIKAPRNLGGARVWLYEVSVPVLDRGVGGTSLSSLKFQLSLVYLGPDGGMGIYGVKISN
jgi:hypothetical protein